MRLKSEGRIINSVMIWRERYEKFFQALNDVFLAEKGKMFKNLRVNIEIDFLPPVWSGRREDAIYFIGCGSRNFLYFTKKVSNFHFQAKIGILFNCHIITAYIRY